MADFIIVIILVILIGGAVSYIIKAKKSGAKCIGCSAGGNCCTGGRCRCGGEQTGNKTSGQSAEQD